MADTRASTNPVHVNESQDGARQFVLHPADDDLFVRTGRQVIEDCRLGISIELWMKELSGVLDEVRRWSIERRDRIRACYCAPTGSRITFFFAPVGEQFDFDLADNLAQFNAELLHKFNVGMVELHQIPWDEWERFLTLETGRHVYGDDFSAQGEYCPSSA
jgi:hypothetical protein